MPAKTTATRMGMNDASPSVSDHDAAREVNPLGDEALEQLDDWWEPTSCAAAALEASDD